MAARPTRLLFEETLRPWINDVSTVSNKFSSKIFSKYSNLRLTQELIASRLGAPVRRTYSGFSLVNK